METSAGTRILLTTVTGPYGVKDEYAEALGMQMELFNNQMTREQGVHSPRFNYWTFPLYFLAENIAVPATILDFPTWSGFVRELKQGYTHIGLSFIQTNVLKAKRMAEYVRRHYPAMKIIVGGYASGLPDLRSIVPCDAVCPGEGIRWLREYFGEDPEQPVKHPVMYGVARQHLYGAPNVAHATAAIFPGLGCKNGCFFCSTSGKFNKQYIPFLHTGRDVFALCREAETRLGVDAFVVLDENLLKETDRARELVGAMEENGKTYQFSCFASAETLREFGVDFLVRMGVFTVWIGVETQKGLFDKLSGIDIAAMIRDLQDHGVSVLSSSILFLEHHTVEGLQADIDWAISLGSDIHQFMQLTPLPGAPLYADYLERGLLIPDFPYTKMSGQCVLNFYHPHFTSEEATEITRKAFRKKYDVDGPGILNLALTALRGYIRARADHERREKTGERWDPATMRYVPGRGGAAPDPYMALRVEEMRRRAMELRPVCTPAALFAPNARTRRKARDVEALYRATFGPPTLTDRAKAAALSCTATLEALRFEACRWLGEDEFCRQPPMRRMEYRH